MRKEANGGGAYSAPPAYVPAGSSPPRSVRRRRRHRQGAAVLAAAMGLSLLTACGGDSSGPPTLTWYINPDSGGQQTIAQKCTQQAGGAYQIETSLLPRNATGQREQLLRRLAAKDEAIDLMSLDPPFIAEFAEAGFLAEIPQDVAEELTQGVVESSVKDSTWKDELVTVPFWANTQLLWYKKSVAEEAGLDMEQPVTWQQLIEAAGQTGTELAVQGVRDEAYTVWINALIESAGGSIIESPEAPADEVQFGIATEAGREAAQVIQTIANQGLGGSSLSNTNEDASASAFEAGDASFMVNWPFVYPRAQGKVESGALEQSVVDDYGWALYPRTVEGEESAPPKGGINLGISDFSSNKDLALEAAQCIVQPENQKAYFLSDGNPPSALAVFDDPEVQEAYPMAPLIGESLEAAAPRPQTPYYNEVSVGLQSKWHPPSSVSPDGSPEAAENYIQNVLQKEDLL